MNIKQIIIALAIISFVGLFLGSIFGMKSALNIDQNLEEHFINESIELSINGITKINVFDVSTDINIVVVESDNITIKHEGLVRSISWGNEPPLVPELKVLKLGDRIQLEMNYPKHHRNLFYDSDRTLTIYLPKKYAEEINLDSVSSDLKAEELNLKKLKIELISGDVNIGGLFSKTEINTVSGDIELNDFNGELMIDTISGDIELEYKNFDEAVINTVSGDVSIELLNNQGLVLDYESVSGDYESNLPITIISNDRDHIKGTINYGTKDLIVDTVSGDLRIS